MSGGDRAERLSLDELRTLVETRLGAEGFVDPERACLSIDCVRATAEGHLAHGVGALYVLDRMRALIPGTGPIDVRGSVSTGIRIDAPGHLGHLPCRLAVERLLEAQGSIPPVTHAVVVSRGHRGRIGHIARALADAGRLAIVCQSTEPAVRVDGSTTPGVGTNPLAIAVPIRDDTPLVVDITAVGVSFAQSFLDEGAGEFAGLAVDSDRVTRGRVALALGVQALAGVLAGIGPLEPDCWSTVILCMHPPSDRSLTRELAEHWTRALGWSFLPGQRSRNALRVAETDGVLIPAPILRWLRQE